MPSSRPWSPDARSPGRRHPNTRLRRSPTARITGSELGPCRPGARCLEAPGGPGLGRRGCSRTRRPSGFHSAEGVLSYEVPLALASLPPGQGWGTIGGSHPVPLPQSVRRPSDSRGGPCPAPTCQPPSAASCLPVPAPDPSAGLYLRAVPWGLSRCGPGLAQGRRTSRHQMSQSYTSLYFLLGYFSSALRYSLDFSLPPYRCNR